MQILLTWDRIVRLGSTGSCPSSTRSCAVLLPMGGWDERKLQVVELHYFGGLKPEEISEAFDLTLPTVRRDLILGRPRLREQFA